VPNGRVVSFWWTTVVALDVDLAAGRIVLDYGGNQPRDLSGPFAPTLAVTAIAGIY
jgi:hypothetical protein